MPTQAKNLSKNNLKADNLVYVLLAKMDLRAEMFDGKTLAGPVPNIFAHDRQEALDGLLANPELALADIVQLNERFLQMEHITLAEAVTFLGKGRIRAARGTAAFSQGSTSDQAAKRPRGAAGPGSETGET